MFGFDSGYILHILRNGGGEYNVRIHVGYVMAHKAIISPTVLIGMVDGKDSTVLDRFQILVLGELVGGGRNAKLFDEGAHAGGFHCSDSMV